MNDDFLRRAWQPPSAEFTSRLRERLRQQELAQTPRRRSNWRLLAVLLLIGGAAVAAMYLTVKDVPFLAFFVSEARQESAATATHGATSASNNMRYYSQQSGTTANPRSLAQTQSASVTARDSVTSSEEAIDASATADSNGTLSASGSNSVAGTGTSIAPAVNVVVSANLAGIMQDPNWRASPEPTARIETSNTDDALRRLCTKAANSADIVIVPRRINQDELALCKEHGDGVLETTLAHMVIVVTRAKAGSAMPISADTLLRALLKKVPSPQAPYQLIDNPYTNWNQLDRSGPESRIEVVGPPRSSREFQVFAAAVLEPACERWIGSLQGVERSDYEDMCHTLREDGVYQEAPWDNTFIRQRLWANPNLVGIIDYRFYSANSDDLAGSLLTGPAPTRDSILNGSYAGTRAIRFYVNGTRFERAPAVKQFVNEYLRREGLTFSQPLMPPDGHLGAPWISRPANLIEATAE